MSSVRHNNGWVIWLSVLVALLLSIMPIPFSDHPQLRYLELGRPLWLAMVVAYWALAVPERMGMFTAWFLGLISDVLQGTLLGQHALVLMLVVFMVLSLQRRLQMFPVWQQGLVLLVVFGLAQLVLLWLNTLTGDRPPTLFFILPALISALLWPWVVALLRSVQRRFAVS